MANAVSIRDACASDRGGIRDLYRATFTATYGPTLEPSALAAMLAALDASELRHMLPGQDERAAVAVLAGQVVGSAVSAERGRVAYLWGMYVHPAQQRQGIGTALLGHVLGWLSLTASVEVCVLPSSPWAVAFYGRHGFQQTGQESFEAAPGHAVQALVMTVSRTTLQDRLGRPLAPL